MCVRSQRLQVKSEGETGTGAKRSVLWTEVCWFQDLPQETLTASCSVHSAIKHVVDVSFNASLLCPRLKSMEFWGKYFPHFCILSLFLLHGQDSCREQGRRCVLCLPGMIVGQRLELPRANVLTATSENNTFCLFVHQFLEIQWG